MCSYLVYQTLNIIFSVLLLDMTSDFAFDLVMNEKSAKESCMAAEMDKCGFWGLLV
jgi:hypothetical protein